MVDEVAKLLGGDVPEEKPQAPKEPEPEPERKPEPEPERKENEEREEPQPEVTPAAAMKALGKEKDSYTLKEAADALQIPTDALYKMAIPLNDGSGRHLSVEDLKAGYLAGDAGQLDGERHELNRQKAVFEGRQIEHENATIRAKQELATMVGLLEENVPEAVLTHTRALAQQFNRREANALLEIMPQFRDEKARADFQNRSANTLADYGFSTAEALAIADHRVYKVLDDFMRLRARVAELENVEGDRITPPKTVKRRRQPDVSTNRHAVDRASQPGATREDKVAGVAALIGNA